MKSVLLVCLLGIGLGSFPSAARAPDPSSRLRKAVEAYSRGLFNHCVELCRGLDRSSLLNRDTALFLAGQCHFYAGQFEPARRLFLALKRRFPRSIHFGLAAHRAADCAWEMGRQGAAVDEYRKASRLPHDPRSDPAVGLDRRLSFRLGRGEHALAARLWFELCTRFPAHPLAAEAKAGMPEPRQPFDRVLSRAQALHRIRRWEEALAVLDEAREPLGRAQRYAMAYQAGRILFDMRDRYEEALQILLAARDHAPDSAKLEDAWFYASRALGRLDRDAEAVASHLAMVARYPKGQHAERALYYAGWLEQNQGRCERALVLFERLLSEYPDGDWTDEARWFSAWCHVRNERWKRVIETLAPQSAQFESEMGGRALYWTAVAQHSLGDNSRARTTLQQVIARFPLTWYSLLARMRLGTLAPTLGRPPKAAPMKPSRDRLLARADELTSAGLATMAGLLLRKQEKDFLARHPHDAGLMTLMDAYRRAGDFNRPWLLALREGYRRLCRLPTARTRFLWQHAYSPCRRALLAEHADSNQLVLFLQAIMRTESGFDAQAHSVANARGLMQMIPPTTRRVAKELNLGYSDERLFEPEFNIQTAAWYIGRLAKKFHHQWPLVASAYNGGATAMMDWCRENGRLPLDQFVEAIPWTESRRYTKRVMEAFARYAYLEDAPLPLLRQRVNPDFLDDGIDY